MKKENPRYRLRPWIISTADFRRYPGRALAASALGRVLFVRSANRLNLCLLVPINDPRAAEAAIQVSCRDPHVRKRNARSGDAAHLCRTMQQPTQPLASLLDHVGPGTALAIIAQLAVVFPRILANSQGAFRGGGNTRCCAAGRHWPRPKLQRACEGAEGLSGDATLHSLKRVRSKYSGKRVA